MAQKIRQGDKAAFERLVNANLRFVVSVAKQYQNRGVLLEDLITAGNDGLRRAAEAGRFDETKGFKFISFAVWWIRQAIIVAIAEQARIIRLPFNELVRIKGIKYAGSEFEQKFERNPSVEEIAEILGLDSTQISQSLAHDDCTISFDAPVYLDSSESTLSDVTPDVTAPAVDEMMAAASLKTEVEALLATLDDTEYIVIVNFFGLDGHEQMTLDNIARLIKRTRERTRQIKDIVLKRLSQKTKVKELRYEYLS